MQSTGQGGRHNLQPMHQSAMTACRNPLAPLIASTGHASMQRVQPMQRASSISATKSLFTSVDMPKRRQEQDPARGTRGPCRSG